LPKGGEGVAEIISIGPFIIPARWLWWALGGMTGYAVMKHRLKKSGYADRPVMDMLLNGLLLAALLWKFSPLLFNPSLLWENPQGVLFMSGGTGASWLAAAAGTAYIAYQCWKLKEAPWLLPDLLAYGILSMVTVLGLLSWEYGAATALPWGISIEDPAFKYHPVNLYKVMVALPLLLWLLRRKPGELGSGYIFGDFLAFFGTGFLLVSLFKTPAVWLFGISLEQFFYLFLIGLGSFLSIRLGKLRKKGVM
jgi:prolipoprotein diacylglyceryltransferase